MAMPASLLVVCLFAGRLAEGAYSYDSYGACVYPEICRPPAHKYSKVLPVKGRFQWDESGGFCGSLSIQTMALTHGAWISQDKVRQANRGGLCFGHTDVGGGCEVGPENYGLTARNLKLDFSEWDYSQPSPQAAAFKRWIKSHLVKGNPVMWAPLLKDDKHTLYGRVSVPGNGHFDHHEPIIGIGSNHELSDPEVYADDWLVHYSDYDLQPCYRNFSTLEDDADMQGNCRDVRPGKGVMYPCFYREVTYGLAIKGLSMFGVAERPRVHLEVDRPDEPRVRMGRPQVAMRGTLTVKDLTPGRHYVIYRFNSTEALPDGAIIDLLDMRFEQRYPFQAQSESWVFADPKPIMSDSATYYVAIRANLEDVRVADSLKERVPQAFLREQPVLTLKSAILDVRPTGDPELARNPQFRSLAEYPTEWRWVIGCLSAVVAACVAVATFYRRIRRSGPLLEQPALG